MNRLRSILVILLLIFPFSGQLYANTEIEDAISRWANAFDRKDAKGIVALYAEDAVFFGTTSPVLRDTPELVWDYFKGLGELGDSTISVGDHRIQMFGNTAVNTGFYSRHYTEAGVKKSDHARFTFVYQKRADQWLIVEHHSSAMPE